MRVALLGLGAVGAEVARHLLADPVVTSVVVMHRDPDRVASTTRSLLAVAANRSGSAGQPGGGAHLEVRRGGAGALPEDTKVVVMTHPLTARDVVNAALSRGTHVVSTVDEPLEVRRLLGLDAEATLQGLTVVVGAAMAPGLSGVLARFGAGRLDVVDQIHVASLGTGGPQCAHRHHDALSSLALDWVGGTWRRRPGGSGRELAWFPEPAGGADCYRAGLADPVLLVPAFPSVHKVTARLAATRRDRMTSWLPMLRRPHPEGLVGAVRVELRGWRNGIAEVVVFGAVSRPAAIAGAVASQAAGWAAGGRLARSGAAGLAELVPDPGTFLRELYPRGVRTAQFEGSEPDEVRV